MAEERQIDAISIGIGANVAGLKASLDEAQRVVSSYSFRPPNANTLPVNVQINTGGAEQKLQRFIATERVVNVSVILQPTASSLADFRKLIRTKLAEGEDIQIPFKAQLQSAKNIKKSIQDAVTAAGAITVQVAWEWENGPPPSGGQPGGPPSAGPAPRRGGPRGGGGGGGGGTTTAAPPATPTPTSTSTPRIVTRPPRPVTARTGQPATPTIPPVIVPGGLPPRYTNAPSRSNTEFQPGTGAARGQGVPPSMNQRLKTAIAHLMRTGDPTDIFKILGPYQSMTGSLGRFEGYNLPGLGGEQVNLKQLIDQAMNFATNYGQRRGANQPLREFQEFTPRQARFAPTTVETGERAISGALAFARRASARAAGSGGAYSDLDVHIADRRRRILNAVQTQLHAEDPKAFKAAFDTRRGSVSRLKDFGLMSLAQLGGARAALKQIGPPTPDFLETLAASERHNKQLQTNANRIENARKRAMAADREAQTVINEQTGRKRTIPSRGLPFVQSQGISDVESYLNLLNQAEEDQSYFSLKRKGFALGGRLTRKGFVLKSLLQSDVLGSPDAVLPQGYDLGYMDSSIPRHSQATTSPLSLPNVLNPNLIEQGLGGLRRFSKNALGGHLRRFAGGGSFGQGAWKKYSCPIEGKKFMTEKGLNWHTENVHGEGRFHRPEWKSSRWQNRWSEDAQQPFGSGREEGARPGGHGRRQWGDWHRQQPFGEPGNWKEQDPFTGGFGEAPHQTWEDINNYWTSPEGQARQARQDQYHRARGEKRKNDYSRRKQDREDEYARTHQGRRNNEETWAGEKSWADYWENLMRDDLGRASRDSADREAYQRDYQRRAEQRQQEFRHDRTGGGHWWEGFGGGSEADTKIDKLKRMATQETQSPNEASIAKRILHDKGIPGYALGGLLRRGLGGAAGHLQRFFQNANIELPEASHTTLHELADVANDFATAYPDTASSLRLLRQITNNEQADFARRSGGQILGGVTSGHSLSNKHDLQIALNPVLLADRQLAHEEVSIGRAVGWHPNVQDPSYQGSGGYLSHELGHLTDRSRTAAEAMGIPFALDKAGRGTEVSQIPDLLSRLIKGSSTYAGQDPAEAWADQVWSFFGKTAIPPTFQHFLEQLSERETHTTHMSIALPASMPRGGGPAIRLPGWMPRRAGGGYQDWGASGAIVVGEQGDEVFVPESAGWIIPHRLMDQLPKRAGGGHTPSFKSLAAHLDKAKDWAMLFLMVQEEGKKKKDQSPEDVLAAGAAGQLHHPNIGRLPRRATGGEEGNPDDPIKNLTAKQWKARQAQFDAARTKKNEEFEAEEAARKELLQKTYYYDPNAGPAPQPVPEPRSHRAPAGGAGAYKGGQFIPNDPIRAARGPAPQPVTAKASGGLNFNQLPPNVQAQYAGQAGVGPPPPPTPTSKPLSLAESEQVRFATRESEEASRREAVLRRANVTGQVAQAAARAFGPDIGQIVATQTGRAGIILRQRLAALAETDVRFAEARVTALRGRRLEAQVRLGRETDPEQIDKLRGQIEALNEAETVAVNYQEKYTAGATLASKSVATLSDKIKTLGGNFGGILAGTIVYGAVFRGIQTALDAAVPALGSFIDEQTGLHSKMTQVTTALGDQTTAAHGNVDAVLANVAASAGMNKESLDLISSQLKLTTQIKAGTTAQQAASDLYRGAAGTGQGVPQGLFGGYGGILGSGLLAQTMGGGKGFSEIVQGDLSNLSRPQGGSDLGALINQGLSYIANPDFRGMVDTQAQAQGQSAADMLEGRYHVITPILGGLGDWIHGGPPNNPNADAGFIGHGPVGQALGGLGDLIFRGGKAPAQQLSPEQRATQQTQQRDTLGFEKGGLVQGYLKNLNDNIAKVGGSAKYIYAGSDAAGQKLRDAGVAAAKAAGDLNGITAASQGFVVMIGNAVAGTKDYTTALEQAARGAALPSADVVQAALNRQREITQGTLDAQAAFQQMVMLPQQAAMQYYSNRPLPVGAGVVPGTVGGGMTGPATFRAGGAQGFGGFPAVDVAATQAFTKYRSIAQGAYNDVAAYAKEGLDSLRAAGITGVDEYKAIGDQINAIQTDLVNQQATQSAVEYNHQLYITNRSLQDARALVGQRVKGEQSNLGFLQREDYLLGRQSTLLSLNLSQRQINFQRAIAGFQAPGLTSEERGARMAEAKLEADYAQRQLNIQKRQFVVGGQIFTVSARRQLRDVQFALADLQRGHRITVNAAAANQTISLLQQKMTIAGNKIGIQLSREEQIFAAKINESATIAATATGTAFSAILKGVDAAWTAFGKGASAYAAYISAINTVPAARNTSSQYSTNPGHAAGFFGTISSATSMIVGEAGSETVAVLSHPRTMAYTPSGGGAGDSGLTVNFYGAIVREESDLPKIVAAVERAMQKRASLTLPRRA